jgi:GNAT superfamily N-acetyltransferase
MKAPLSLSTYKNSAFTPPGKLNMRFEIHQVNPESPEFGDLVACEVTSFDKPFQSIFRFFYPIFGAESESEKKTALANLIELQRQWARDDPDSIWLKVIDKEEGDKIVGGLLIKVHKENPFSRDKGKDESAVWYPPGGQREYIDAALGIFNEPRERFMQRAHLCTSPQFPYANHMFELTIVDSYIGFVLPEYRQQGIADMLLVEECRRADELGLEAYMEAVTAMGVPIFMRHGFIPFKKVSVEPEHDNPDAEWLDMERKMQPLRFWPMWRPAYGKITPGVTVPPWNEFMSGMLSKL